MRFKVLGLVIWALLFLGAKAHSDTGVAVYNNTLSTLEFSIRQTNTPLEARYWSEGKLSIDPTAADEVLTIKKSGGVKNNTTYGFEIDVSDGSSTLALKIRIEGRAVGRRTYQAVGNGRFSDDKALQSARWGQRTVQFRREQNGDYMFVIADPSKPLLRFPIQDRSLISESTVNPFGGPLTLDMRTGDRDRGVFGISCLSFDGREDPPFCYGGHEGSDFMLKGGFGQMDRPGNYVVAARAGTVVEVRQHLYDRCHAKGFSKDLNALVQPDCDGQNNVVPRSDGNGNTLIGNRIVVDHGDGLYTDYYHLKTNSSLVEEGDEVICGQPLASIGSSGFSTAPHLHFEVLECKDGASCSSWSDSDVVVVNPYNGVYTGRGYWTNQGGGRLPGSQCAAGQVVHEDANPTPARGCKDDSDCDQGHFCNKRIGQNRCLPDGSLQIGAACFKNRECGTDKCQGGQCVCADDGDCGSGQFCNKRAGANRCLAAGTLGVGQACAKNRECQTDKCQGGRCVCERDSDCGSGQFCNKRAGANRCLANSSLGIGQACSKNQECRSDKCQGGRCVCDRDSDCSSGQFCNKRAGANRCLADGTLGINAACSKNKECRSDKCEKGNCVCKTDSDCPGNQRCKKPIGKVNRCE